METQQPATARLRRFRLFEGLTPDELCEAARLADSRSYRRRTVMFRVGDLADRLFLLERGIIKLTTLSPDGVERVLDVVGEGDVFGELLLGRENRRAVTAETLSAAAVWTLAAEAFGRLLERLPRLCLNFVGHLADIQRRAVSRLIAQMEVDRGVRLLAVLLDLGERCGYRTGDDYILPPELTQGELAHIVGVNRSTVNLLVNRYRRGGLLGGQGSVVVVRSAPAKTLLRDAGILSS